MIVVVVLVEVVGRAGCLSLLLMELPSPSIPFRVVFSCGKPGHVTHEVVVVSVGSVWL